ncbi:MAG: GIY-YIG nuclease family protein [Sphingobacteriales bacterium]|nr:MAG: GIY-YIG nuclease family protein [Sphingobacteriales bacterium]
MNGKGGYVYILTNTHHTVLYIGVTAHLFSRIYDHRTRRYKNSFTDKYQLTKLVYYEPHDLIEPAIEREKQLKDWSRRRKETLVAGMNPEWRDLWEDIKDWF